MAREEALVKRALGFVALLVACVVGIALVRALTLGPRDTPGEIDADAFRVDADAVAQRLAGALRFDTISHAVAGPLDAGAFAGLRAYLAATWPRAHAALPRETLGEHSLLYTWRGRDPDAPGLLLAAHQDVVPVPAPEQWQQPPFAGVVSNGEVWGRGALDDKGSLVCILDAVESLLAEGFPPERTVYRAFGLDEELGGDRGARAIAGTLAARGVRLASVLDEGGAVADGFRGLLERPVAAIGIAEKGFVDVRLHVEAPGGHSSTPPRQTAIGILAAAITRLEQGPLPARVRGGAFERFAKQLAPQVGFGRRLALANLWLIGAVIPLVSPDVPILDAMIRTTTAVTMVEGGVKSNVLPRQAEAIVNFRILPGDSMESVLAHVRRSIEDERVSVDVSDEGFADEPSPVSPDESPAFRGIARAVAAVYPDAVSAPYLVVGGTDARHYTRLGDAVYRLLPFRVGEEALRLAHGTDERISVENLGRGVRFYRELLKTPLVE